MLEDIANKYGIGRDMHIGDTIIGIKGRVGFEAAAPCLSSMLTKCSKNIRSPNGNNTGKTSWATGMACFCMKRSIWNRWCAISNSFFESSQQNVTGTVAVKLRPYSYTLVGWKVILTWWKPISANMVKWTKPGQLTMWKVSHQNTGQSDEDILQCAEKKRK